MSIVGFHAIIIIALLFCWLTISGRVAQWQWKDWGHSRWSPLFLGWYFDDLSSLKRFHFWLGWIFVAVILFVYTASIYRYVRGH
ncbi:MAG: hypothetical protein WAO00_02335 [Chthoniobacterales bacterium]